MSSPACTHLSISGGCPKLSVPTATRAHTSRLKRHSWRRQTPAPPTLRGTRAAAVGCRIPTRGLSYHTELRNRRLRSLISTERRGGIQLKTDPVAPAPTPHPPFKPPCRGHLLGVSPKHTLASPSILYLTPPSTPHAVLPCTPGHTTVQRPQSSSRNPVALLPNAIHTAHEATRTATPPPSPDCFQSPSTNMVPTTAQHRRTLAPPPGQNLPGVRKRPLPPNQGNLFSSPPPRGARTTTPPATRHGALRPLTYATKGSCPQPNTHPSRRAPLEGKRTAAPLATTWA